MGWVHLKIIMNVMSGGKGHKIPHMQEMLCIWDVRCPKKAAWLDTESSPEIQEASHAHENNIDQEGTRLGNVNKLEDGIMEYNSTS